MGSEEDSQTMNKVQLEDHSTLIRIEATLVAFITEMRSGNANAAITQADHEKRIRDLESDNAQLKGSRNSQRWMLGVIGVIASLTPFITFLIEHH